MNFTYSGDMKVLPYGTSYDEAQFIFDNSNIQVLSCASDDVVLIRDTTGNGNPILYNINAYTRSTGTYMNVVQGSYRNSVLNGWNSITDNGIIIGYTYPFFISIYGNTWSGFPPYRTGGSTYTVQRQMYDVLEFLDNRKATIPITYNAIGCTLDGPSEAEANEQVSVLVTPQDNRIIRDPTQGKGISVYDKNGYIPFTYTDGTISFTVPSS